MRRQWLVLILTAATCFAPSRLAGQEGTNSIHGPLIDSSLRVWTVSGTVQRLRGEPVPGAIVMVRVTNAPSPNPATIFASTPVEPTLSATWKSLKTNLQGEFTTEFTIGAQVSQLELDLRVTKAGLQKAHEIVEFTAPDKTWIIPVTLREIEEDSELITQAELISTLEPRLKQFPAEAGRSGAAKDYSRGFEELVDQDNPDHALTYFASAARRVPACAACRTMLGLARLASGDWDGAYRDLTEASNPARLGASGARPEALLALGVMESWKHEPKNAAGYFLAALKVAPQDPFAFQELGRSQLLLRNWPAANEYLEKAIAAGAEPEARLLRVQALMGLDEAGEASKVMNAYLAGRDVKRMPAYVRRLWAQVRDQQKAEAVVVRKSHVDQSVENLALTVPELKGLEPAKDQQQLASILAAVGKNVDEFFRNFQSTISLEQIHQEKLRNNGEVGETLDQKFDYLCLTPAEKWGPSISEYRADSSGRPATPHGLEHGFMLTSGFASASLVFHPAYQPDAVFRYLGRQNVTGRDTFVIAFAQQPAKARIIGEFRSGDTSATIYSQGIAWIDAENFQIVHLRKDLLAPVPELSLEKQTTEIDFGEVSFKDPPGTFWLPREVKVAVDWNGKRLFNRHEYSDFKHFNVESKGKLGQPKEIGESLKEEPDRKEPR